MIRIERINTIDISDTVTFVRLNELLGEADETIDILVFVIADLLIILFSIMSFTFMKFDLYWSLEKRIWMH